MNKANALGELGDYPAAVDFYDKAIQIYERLIVKEGRTELANMLAMAYSKAYLNKATTLNALGNHRAGIELVYDLAMTYMNKAIELGDLRDHRAAVDFYDRAIQLLIQLVDVKELRSELL